MATNIFTDDVYIHSLCIQATYLSFSPPHIRSNTSNDKTNYVAKDENKAATNAATKDATIYACNEESRDPSIVAIVG